MRNRCKKQTYNQSWEATRQDKFPRVTHSKNLKKTTITMLEKMKQVETAFMSKEAWNQGSDFLIK